MNIIIFLNKISTPFIIFFFVIYIVFSIVKKKNQLDVDYENVEVCGKVERFVLSPKSGGGNSMNMFFVSEEYGFIAYNKINVNYVGYIYGVDFLNLEKRSTVCFLVKKPINSNNWNDNYFITKILKVKD